MVIKLSAVVIGKITYWFSKRIWYELQILGKADKVELKISKDFAEYKIGDKLEISILNRAEKE